MSLQSNSTEKIAIVHDDFIQSGGAEKLVECLLEMFPTADLYTSVISSEWRKRLKDQNPNLQIYTSFIDHSPFKRSLYKLFSFLYPIAFWVFDFSGYDKVISSTARFAHGIRTPSNTFHIAYVNSPPRMVWEPQNYFNKFLLPLVYPLILCLRIWDRFVCTKPDLLIANSITIKDRIRKYWNRDSTVIYPFHDLNKKGVEKKNKGDHFIIVSRLENWKKIDIAVEACSLLKQPLVVVGSGRNKKALMDIANHDYVKFMGRLPNADLIKIYLDSKALIMTQKEDFGITSVEAQSFGVPVIAFRSGGALETVLENKTGIFFDRQNTEDLIGAIKRFDEIEITAEECIIQASKFTKDEFIRRILDIFNSNGTNKKE